MTRIAIVGPGAVGGTVAAWLSRSTRHDLMLCARTPFNRLEVKTPDGQLDEQLPVVTDPEDAAPVDWVFVATKAYDTEGAAKWLDRLVDGETRVAVLQNGVEQAARFSGIIPLERIVPVIVDIPAERDGPGRIHQRRMGSLTVQDDANGKAFAGLFSGTPFELVLTDDLKTAAWKKLCVNAAGVVSAILLRPSGIARTDRIAQLMKEIVLETIAVGRAEGAVIEDSYADEVVTRNRQAPTGGVNSIHADRLAGRPTEIDARNGVIVRLGECHGIATPLNTMAVALMSVQ